MSAATDVAIIGAGPYGLSLAAHLRARGVDHRIVGQPMSNWLAHMPKGMLLKSEGFASDLYDIDRHFTLRRYCANNGIDYADMGLPVAAANFSAYALDFASRLVSHLEVDTVVGLGRSSAGFLLQLEGGASFTARRVVVATGISHFAYTPASLARLPAEHATHAADHHELDGFRGREVVVIGAGASAVDIAVLLHEAGAKVTMVARTPSLYLHSGMQIPRPLRERLHYPMSGIGPSWRSLFYAELPAIVHRFSEARRLRIVKTHLGPAGGWFMRDRLAAVPLVLGFQPHYAEIARDRVRLQLSARDGTVREMATDHVIAATGYRVDLRRLPFLSPDLGALIRSVEQTPILSPRFESSVPGLYFIGPAAANSFGPVMRFAFGAKFTTPRLASHLAGTATVPAKAAAAPVRIADLLAPSDR